MRAADALLSTRRSAPRHRRFTHLSREGAPCSRPTRMLVLRRSSGWTITRLHRL